MSIAFHPERHAALLDALGRAAESIQAELDTLDREVAVLRGQWSGDAREAYDSAHAQWSQAMEALHRALTAAARAADAAGTRLSQAEEDVAARWA
ncbi:WXG100 family type VII secretion target [Leifsonia aquatica]|uniref:WXG100 family type VII secretion target n=1 Tax=Leifsonia aquatica TaxID=144185 RepID=UPI0028B23EA7|nr:WXG100 family type VII secretion target [Leifsonia aquatica]